MPVALVAIKFLEEHKKISGSNFAGIDQGGPEEIQRQVESGVATITNVRHGSNKAYIEKKEALKMSQLFYYIQQRQQFAADAGQSNAYTEQMTGAGVKIEHGFGIPDINEIEDAYYKQEQATMKNSPRPITP